MSSPMWRNEVRAIGFHFFARGPGVSHAYVRVETVGEPVTVGGLTVNPGNLIHADQHGMLLIPRGIAADLPAAADRVIAAEQEFIHWVRPPEFAPPGWPKCAPSTSRLLRYSHFAITRSQLTGSGDAFSR